MWGRGTQEIKSKNFLLTLHHRNSDRVTQTARGFTIPYDARYVLHGALARQQKQFVRNPIEFLLHPSNKLLLSYNSYVEC